MAVTESPPLSRRGARPPVGAGLPVLAGAFVLAAAIILWAGRSTTFVGDEWGWIFGALHPTSGTFLNPDNGHLMATTQAFYNGMLRVFGLGHYLAYRLGALALHLVVAALVYVLARRRLGASRAIVPAVAVALLGSGADAFLGAINIGILAATAAGLAAFALAEPDTRRGDAGACVMLVLALLSWTSAVALTAGLAVELACRRRWPRLWVAAVPAVLYVGWRLHWAGGLFSGIGVPGAPKPGPLDVLGHALQAASGSVAGVLGVQLMSPTLRHDLPWLGTATAVIVSGLAVVLGVWWARGRRSGRGWGVTPRFAGLLTAGLVLWVLIGLARGTLGDTYASRYVYAGGVVVVLLGVEAAPVVWPGRSWRRAILGLAAVTIALNLVWMVVWGNHLRAEATLARAQLGALDLAGPAARPAFRPGSEFALADVTAGRYFAARRRFGGTPADSAAKLAAAPEAAREAADGVLDRAGELSLVGGTRRCLGTPAIHRGSGLLTLSPLVSGGVGLSVPAQGAALIAARRFARRFTVGVGGLGAGQSATIRARVDDAPQPWEFRAYYSAGLRVCSAS